MVKTVKQDIDVNNNNDILDFRKTIYLTKGQLRNWNANKIREFLDGLSSNKMTMSRENNDTKTPKSIRLTKKQSEKWDSSLVKRFLDGLSFNKMTTSRENNDTLKILIDCILEFNKLMALTRPVIPPEINKELIKKGVLLSSQKKK